MNRELLSELKLEMNKKFGIIMEELKEVKRALKEENKEERVEKKEA